jgi:hypothetical protein
MGSKAATLAWIHVVVSGVLLVFGISLVVSSAMDTTYSETALPLISVLFFWIATFLLLPSFIGGLALVRRKAWGRILLILVSIELLFVVPVGTALGIFGLMTLMGKEARRSVPTGAPTASGAIVQRSNTGGLLLTMAGVAAGFLILIGGGFLLSGDERLGISPGALIATGLLIGGAVGAVFLQWRHPDEARPPVVRRLEPETTVKVTVAEPAPVCRHLQPVESTIRAAGIRIHSSAGTFAHASCRINVIAFERRFGPKGPVSYSEYFQPERHPEDNPTACLVCSECNSRLFTLHPYESSTATAWFPAPPPALDLLAATARTIPGSVTAIAVTLPGRMAAVASALQNASECAIWDVARRERLRHFSVPGVMRALAWTRDERFLVAGRGVPWTGGPGNRGASLFVFDPASGVEVKRFGAELYGVRGMALSPDSRMLLVSAMHGETAADGSSIGLWDLGLGRLLSTVAHVESSGNKRMPYFTDVAFSQDGELLVAGCDFYYLPAGRAISEGQPPWWWNRGVRVWRNTSGAFREIDVLRCHTGVNRVAVSSDGQRLFAAGDRLGIWALGDGAVIWDRRGSSDHAVVASSDGRLVVGAQDIVRTITDRTLTRPLRFMAKTASCCP